MEILDAKSRLDDGIEFSNNNTFQDETRQNVIPGKGMRRAEAQPSLLCFISNPTKRKAPTAGLLLLKILTLITLNNILNQISYTINNDNHFKATTKEARETSESSSIYKSLFRLPTVILAGKYYILIHEIVFYFPI